MEMQSLFISLFLSAVRDKTSVPLTLRVPTLVQQERFFPLLFEST
jgi:hypothetical protein